MSETREIPLSRGMVAIVDAADFDWLSQWKWCALHSGGGRFYAFRVTRQSDPQGKGHGVLMHRQIMGEPDALVVDHEDRDTLNCRRGNLRITTQAGNSLNQTGHRDRAGSRFKGVWLHKKNGNWVASFRGKHLGCFAIEEDAARAYDAAAVAHDPVHAVPNFAKVA